MNPSPRFPAVSVVISAYQAEKTLTYCLKSVLAQDCPGIEVIVVNNGSRDGTQALIDKFAQQDARIHPVILTDNQLPSGGRNAGIAHANADLIAFLDADDAWDRTDKLSKQLEILNTCEDIGLIFSDCVSVDENTRKQRLYSSYNHLLTRGLNLQPLEKHPDILVLSENAARMIYSGNFINLSTVVARKSLLQQEGCFHSGLFGTEDIDLWVRLARRSSFAYWTQTSTTYYFRQTSTSRLTDRRIRELIKYHTYCKTAEPYQAMQDLVMKNLEYCYKLLILEHARQWQPLQAWHGWIESGRSGVRSFRLLPYALSALLGPIPLLINNRVIRPIRNRINF